jgi:hypothetical protein
MFDNIIIVLLFFSIISSVRAQRDSSIYNFGDFGGIILLDSIVVTASRNSLDIQDFVDMVRNDESFYTAFSNLRTHSYSADNHIKMYNKKHKVKAEYYCLTKQDFYGKCRTMIFENERVGGNFFKKKRKYRYYTAKLYDRLFFTKGKVCLSDSGDEQNQQATGMEKHVTELKKLIFSPGEKANIPLIGKKTEIFSKEMTEYYDYSIASKSYKDSVDCYVFGVKTKQEYLNHKKGKTVIKTLETYFEKSTFQVIARNYTLTYEGSLFDFDVNMVIELKKVNNYYVPGFIKYDGWWDIPTKKPEISTFSARFYDFY